MGHPRRLGTLPHTPDQIRRQRTSQTHVRQLPPRDDRDLARIRRQPCRLRKATARQGHRPRLMPGRWDNSTRASRLPPDWAKRVAAIKRRDQGQCTCSGCDHCTGTPCRAPGRDVDHIKPGDDHQLANLQLLCRWCHDLKTRHEGTRARPKRSGSYPAATPPGLS